MANEVSSAPDKPRVTRRSRSSLLLFGFALVGAALLWRAATVSLTQLTVPFSLGPAETLNLETIKLIRAGRNPYGAETYLGPPFALTMYTPLYHYLVSLLPMPDEVPFLSGRAVAAAAMWLAGALLFLVAPGRAIVVPLAAFCLFHALWPISSRTAFLRNDSLALLLSGLAIVSVHRAGMRRGWGAAAAVFCVLAVFTKQSFVAASLACALYLLLGDRRALREFIGTGLLVSGVFLIAAHGLWGSGFWFCVINGPRNPITISRALYIASLVVRQPLFVAVVGSGFLLATLSFRRRGSALFSESPYFLYAIIATGILLASVGRERSGDNYFFESLLALLLWVTWELSRVPQMALPGRRPALVAALLLAAVAIADLATSQPSDYSIAQRLPFVGQNERGNRVRSTIESLGFEEPTVVGVIEHPGLHRESDRVRLSIPLLYYDLWKAGVLEYTPFLESIARQEFDVIVVPRLFLKRASALPVPYRAIAESMRRSYEAAAQDSRLAYYVARVERRSPSVD